ncbi:hypothetical protein [Bacillus mesophilum]|uniref:Uncharacterized protein n=1 Tax=Bacillus mesophilum TaxID=1071718 RepID=A0A7V7UWL7_9BACI|nr:hypothetical protein [Bacillus mesophilum]KAB2335091.1 hypothetical protein F7732_00515 [Bacillus mesophilum]
MIRMKVMLHDGTSLTADDKAYNPADIEATLNNQRIQIMTIGNVLVNKNVIQSISPESRETDSNLYISYQNGLVVEAYDENFNSTDLGNKLNDQKNLFVAVGDVIINKNLLKMIAPVQSA